MPELPPGLGHVKAMTLGHVHAEIVLGGERQPALVALERSRLSVKCAGASQRHSCSQSGSQAVQVRRRESKLTQAFRE